MNRPQVEIRWRSEYTKVMWYSFLLSALKNGHQHVSTDKVYTTTVMHMQIRSRDLLGTPETSFSGRRTLTARSVRRSIWLPDWPDWLGANSVMNLRRTTTHSKVKLVLPYSLPSVGPRADPGVQAVSLHVTLSHLPGGRLPLLSARPAVSFSAKERFVTSLNATETHMP